MFSCKKKGKGKDWRQKYIHTKKYKTKSTSSKKKTYLMPDGSYNADFYRSREWLEARYLALVKFGRKCMCCGATSDDGVKMHVDHIKPRSKFPSLELDVSNLQVLCSNCNIGKSNKHTDDFRAKDKP